MIDDARPHRGSPVLLPEIQSGAESPCDILVIAKRRDVQRNSDLLARSSAKTGEPLRLHEVGWRAVARLEEDEVPCSTSKESCCALRACLKTLKAERNVHFSFAVHPNPWLVRSFPLYMHLGAYQKRLPLRFPP